MTINVGNGDISFAVYTAQRQSEHVNYMKDGMRRAPRTAFELWKTLEPEDIGFLCQIASLFVVDHTLCDIATNSRSIHLYNQPAEPIMSGVRPSILPGVSTVPVYFESDGSTRDISPARSHLLQRLMYTECTDATPVRLPVYITPGNIYQTKDLPLVLHARIASFMQDNISMHALTRRISRASYQELVEPCESL